MSGFREARSMARLLALLIGLVFAGGLLVGGIRLGGADGLVLSGESADSHRFGFQAYYELPQKRPGDWCGTDNGGPTWSRWVEGPHEHFEELDSSHLAPESLNWFEKSPEASEWRENPTARLELTYPSDGRQILVRYASDAKLTWEEQLGLWFERFPPGDESLHLADDNYNWTVKFGDRGQVRGRADSDTNAIELMESLLADTESVEHFKGPTCSLGFNVRTSSHSMNCFSVWTDRPEQIEDLPRRLREQRHQAGGR